MNVFKAIYGGISDLRNPALWVFDSLGYRQSSAGVNVTPEGALALSVYYGCIRNVAEDISGLPFKVFKRLEPDGKKPDPDHRLWPLIHDEANPEMASQVFWETMLHWAQGWGNSYAEIQQTRSGLRLWPIHPNRVQVKRDLDTAALYYEVQQDNGQALKMKPREIFHLRGVGSDLTGYSVARIGSESIGRAMAVQEFSAKFFGNGTVTSGAFTTPAKLSDKAFNNLKRTWPTGLPNTHKPLFLEEGMKWQPFHVNPDEAQMLETGKDTAVDIARWFRMPLHKIQIMDSATFSNIEHQAREYVGDTLRPWAKRIETEVTRKLMTPADRKTHTAKFVFRALLRGDLGAQTAHYNTMFQIGALSINEIRALEDMNPIDGGDEHMVPLNMGTASETQGTDQPDETQQVEDDEQDTRRAGQVTALKKAHARMFASVAERLALKEANGLIRAAKRYKTDEQFSTWSKKFYDDHIKHAYDSLLPVVMSLAEAICMVYGVAPITADIADAVESELRQWTARQYPTLLGHVGGMLEGLEREPARVAAKMPGLVEATVKKELDHEDNL